MPRNRLMWQPNNDSEQKLFSPLYQNGINTSLNRGQYCPYEENRDVFLHVVCHKQTQSWAAKGVCSFFQDSWIKESKCSFKTFPQAQTSVLELNLNLTSVTFSNDWGTGTAACSGVDRNSLNYSRYALMSRASCFCAWLDEQHALTRHAAHPTCHCSLTFLTNARRPYKN